MNRRRAQRAVVLGLLGGAPLLLVHGATTWAYTDGAEPGDGFEGCAGSTCHTSDRGTSAADSRILVKVQGLPERFAPGARYPVSVSMDAPAALKRAGPEGAVVKSGLAVDARVGNETMDGSFAVEDKRVRLAGETLTHTREGAKTYNWTFMWIAPPRAADPVEVFVTAMSSAGSVTNTDHDSWNTERFLLWPAPAESPAPGVLAVLLLAFAGLRWSRRRGPRRAANEETSEIFMSADPGSIGRVRQGGRVRRALPSTGLACQVSP